MPHWCPSEQPRGRRLPYGRCVFAVLDRLLEHHSGMTSRITQKQIFDDLLKALIFGKAAKSHRSILSWRERYNLPKTTADLTRAASQKAHSSPAWSADSSIFNEKSNSRQSPIDSYSTSPPGYGFGKQGQKQAERNGYVLNKPVHARSNSGGSRASSGRYNYLQRI